MLQDEQFRPGKDAQSKQVLTEIAGLEQMIYTKTGQLFIDHLQSTLFPSLGLDGIQFMRSMTTAVNKKTFANYLQNISTGGRK